MVAHELAEAMDDPRAVVVIEWGDVVGDVLPEKRITIYIEKSSSSDEGRHLEVSSPPEFAYIYDKEVS